MAKIKYPQVVVQLSGENGNAYAIIGRVRAALKDAGISIAERDAFSVEAMSSDYDHVLQTAMAWVDCT